MESDLAELSKSAKLFEVSVPEYKQLRACRREVRLLKELWDMIVLVRTAVCEAAGGEGRRRQDLGDVPNRLLGWAGRF